MSIAARRRDATYRYTNEEAGKTLPPPNDDRLLADGALKARAKPRQGALEISRVGARGFLRTVQDRSTATRTRWGAPQQTVEHTFGGGGPIKAWSG